MFLVAAARIMGSSGCRQLGRMMAQQMHSLASNDGRTVSENMVYRSAEVLTAHEQGRGIVALESTIVAHGMPYPENLKTAEEVEEIIRHRNACPATIAVLDGKINVGLSRQDLSYLAEHGAKRFRKASRRDLAAAVAFGENVATTVSSTALIAKDMAGIDVFVTGGLGGVHRGASETMDVSADLTELGRTPITMVCAGAKSILDIPKTLEVLETQGVPVVGFQTDEFPAFFSRSSGCKVTRPVDNVDEIVSMILANQHLGLRSGMVIAVPIPEEHAGDGNQIEHAIQAALREADEYQISGKEITPFVLKRVNELTGGRSLAANIALVKNNAKVGADISVRLSEALSSSGTLRHHTFQASSYRGDGRASDNSESSRFGCVVIGGAVLDVVASPTPGGPDFSPGTSNPTKSITSNVGGVAKNIALSFTKTAGTPALLVSAVGEDLESEAIVSGCESAGLPTSGLLQCKDANSGMYLAVHNLKGDLLYGVASMGIFEEHLNWDEISRNHSDVLDQAGIIVCDGNISTALLRRVAQYCKFQGKQLWFEPTSAAKCTKIIEANALQATDFCSPNMVELLKMSQMITDTNPDPMLEYLERGEVPVDELASIASPHIATLGEAGLKHCFVSIGAGGVIHGGRNTETNTIYPAASVDPERIVNTNGAGDSFVGATAASIAAGCNLDQAILNGLQAARLSVMSEEAVSPHLSFDQLTSI